MLIYIYYFLYSYTLIFCYIVVCKERNLDAQEDFKIYPFKFPLEGH